MEDSDSETVTPIKNVKNFAQGELSKESVYLLLEKDTLDVAYDMLNQVFRATQKSIDKELQQISKLYGTLLKMKSKAAADDRMQLKAKLDRCKERITKLYQQEEDCLVALKQKIACIEYDNFDERFDRLLVDHLATNGFYETAIQYLKQGNEYTSKMYSALQSDVEFATRIDKDLHAQDITSLQEWCTANRVRLKKISPPSTLEYRLGIYEMLKIAEDESKIAAINYARANLKLAPITESSTTSEVEIFNECDKLLKTALSTVTFSIPALPNALPCTLLEHIQDEFSYKRLRSIFHDEFAKIYRVQKDFAKICRVQEDSAGLTTFQLVCMTGLASLKTQHCRDPDKSQMFKQCQTGHLFGEQNCPVCSEVFAKLRHKLPNAHIQHSKLLDPLSGELIGDNPIILPSTHHIYSLQTINNLLYDPKENKVRCPLTGAGIERGALERIFIMG